MVTANGNFPEGSTMNVIDSYLLQEEKHDTLYSRICTLIHKFMKANSWIRIKFRVEIKMKPDVIMVKGVKGL